MVPGIMHRMLFTIKRRGMRKGCLAAAMACALAGCEAGRGPLAGLDLPETPEPEGPWPELADIPPVPAPGEYGPGAPDPAQGREVAARLKADAALAAVRAGELGAPVLTPQQQAALRARANAQRALAQQAPET